MPLFRRVHAGEARIVVSVVTEAELLVRPLRNGDTAAVEKIEDLLSEDGFEVVAVDRAIARRGAALRSHNRIALADAIIIATALETGCEAIVGNDGEWRQRLPDLPFLLLENVVSRQAKA